MSQRQLFVAMADLLDAIATQADQPGFVLDLRTGAIELDAAPGDEGDPPAPDPDYVSVPRRAPEAALAVKQSFIATLPAAHPDLSALRAALAEEPGRFIHLVTREAQLRALWLAYDRAALLEAHALPWLRSLDIEPQFELPPISATTARGPRGGARIGLFELLLLGGPAEEPTEARAQGRIRRVFRAPGPEPARKAWERIARELAAHHQEPLPPLEGQEALTIGGCQLVLRGRNVELEVPVPTPIWAAFRGDLADPL